MAVTRVTTITIETERVLVVGRRASLLQGWCVACGEPAALLKLEAAVLAGVSPQAVADAGAAGRLHLIEHADQSLYLCLNSLLK